MLSYGQIEHFAYDFTVFSQALFYWISSDLFLLALPVSQAYKNAWKTMQISFCSITNRYMQLSIFCSEYEIFPSLLDMAVAQASLRFAFDR